MTRDYTNNLIALTGGLTADIASMDNRFVSAYVTDTRLMGVLVVYVHWVGTSRASDTVTSFQLPFHQFFYIDCEEAGLETYNCVRGEFGTEATILEHKLIAGLGARKIRLNKNELVGLLCKWRNFNIARNLPLPTGYKEYGFIFESNSAGSASGSFSHDDSHSAICPADRKACVEITSDYQAVNYFLMRCFGKDYEGALYLCDYKCQAELPGIDSSSTDSSDRLPFELFDSYDKATFCRNTVDLNSSYPDDTVSYICESLVEMKGVYEIAVTKVFVRDLKVVGFQRCSGFTISQPEAAMILSRPEHVMLFEVLMDEEVLEDNLGEFILGLNTLMSVHENGRMFMSYKPHNNHVHSKTFMLSNDVLGVYFLTDYGQLLVMTYTDEDMKHLKKHLDKSPLSPYLVKTEDYYFNEPAFFEFVDSDFADFTDFAKAIGGNE